MILEQTYFLLCVEQVSHNEYMLWEEECPQVHLATFWELAVAVYYIIIHQKQSKLCFDVGGIQIDYMLLCQMSWCHTIPWPVKSGQYPEVQCRKEIQQASVERWLNWETRNVKWNVIKVGMSKAAEAETDGTNQIGFRTT